MKRHISVLCCAFTTLASAFAQQHFELSLDSTASAQSLSITGGDHFEAPHGTTAIERAIRAVEQRIDEKRAADAARSPLQPFWEAGFWKSPLMMLIPIAAGPQRDVDDPFFTPAYLTVPGRQIEHQLSVSEKRTLFQSGH